MTHEDELIQRAQACIERGRKMALRLDGLTLGERLATIHSLADTVLMAMVDRREEAASQLIEGLRTMSAFRNALTATRSGETLQ